MWDGDYAKALKLARRSSGNWTIRACAAIAHFGTIWPEARRGLAVKDGDTTLEGPARASSARQRGVRRNHLADWPRSRRGHAANPGGVEPGYTDAPGGAAGGTPPKAWHTAQPELLPARAGDFARGCGPATALEAAQVLLGRPQHLGFSAGKRETDASPDPWWQVGDVVIVFEDHANAGTNAVIDATKARQAASHPDWVREHVPGAAGGTVLSVLVTPAKKAKEGARPPPRPRLLLGPAGISRLG